MRRIIWIVLMVAGASLLSACAGTMEGSGSEPRQVERHERPTGGY